MSGLGDEAQQLRTGSSKPVDPSTLHMLVYSYMLHNNCGRSAKAFARTCGLATSGRLASNNAPEYLSTMFNVIDEDISVDTASAQNMSTTKGKEKSSSEQATSLPRKQMTVDTSQKSEFRKSVGSAMDVDLTQQLVNDACDTMAESCSTDSFASMECPTRKDSGMTDNACGDSISKTHDDFSTATCATPSSAVACQSAEAERANELIDHHIEYLRIRQSICSSIEAGEPEVALDLLSTYFRAVLIPPPSSDKLAVSSLPLRREFNATLLRFRLDTQYYVELIANHQELDALQFGQRALWRYPEIFNTWLEQSLGFVSSNHKMHQQQRQQNSYLRESATLTQAKLLATEASNSKSNSCSDTQRTSAHMAQATTDINFSDDIVPREELKQKRAEVMQHITEVAALVAYTDPHKSTLAYLLSQDRRQELAAAVNTAILASMRFPQEPALITLVRQLATTSAYLVGYRSSSSSSHASSTQSSEDRLQGRQQPWGLDTFVNSDTVTDTFA
ncbi:hypothetical protein COEREDRAFT_79610 [Coemansia reversa NRRL 1564]|uniref:CRA domain-containing protein n=1 Tax=Coemansia reversa (strain ATCC 12441 / NRRL 1564) TaxID=763665 RepID=A0A2G5BHS7_COERN|nr:hypothetical protein COEREDRAFT_79610 [Coemansia reversa NRRL 1564]|eukprot:PIA18570.1 hypothetical protein COEREDRAFT_79610 [Coemansia reversa NRRL 1564]